MLPVSSANYLTARFEWSQRDELFADRPALETILPRWFDISAYTAGFTRDVGHWRDANFGLGANATGYEFEKTPALTNIYGDHPWAVSMYLRVRLQPAR